jgi:hypothetical protein
MSVERAFGELRSLLSQAPSELLWEQLCALCDAEVAVDTGRFEAEVLPYVLDGLAGWPDALRTAPRRWIDAIIAAGDHPCGPLVRRLAPPIPREQALWLTASDKARLLAAPCLSQVAELSLRSLIGGRISALEGASMLGAVRVLELENTDVRGAEGIFEQLTALTTLRSSFGSALRSSAALVEDALEASGRLPAMEVLWMGGGAFDEARAARLGVCKRLRELALWESVALGDAGVAALCEALADAPLTQLNVGGCGLTGASMARIAAAPWRLEGLLIWDNALSEDAATLLGEHEAFGALRLLNVNKTRLSGGALAPLLSRRGPQPLRELWCEELPELSSASWEAQGDTARGLEVLVASRCGLHRQGAFEGLMEGMDGGRMRRMLIPRSGLGAAHMLALRDARLPDLRELDLNANPITDEGVAAEWIEGLEVLKLSWCELSVAAVELLRAQAPRLGALRELHMQVKGVSDKELREAICGALPDLKLKVVSWG